MLTLTGRSKKEITHTECEFEIQDYYQEICNDQKWTGAFQLVGYTTYQTQFVNDTSKTRLHANGFVQGGK